MATNEVKQGEDLGIQSPIQMASRLLKKSQYSPFFYGIYNDDIIRFDENADKTIEFSNGDGNEKATVKFSEIASILRKVMTKAAWSTTSFRELLTMRDNGNGDGMSTIYTLCMFRFTRHQSESISAYHALFACSEVAKFTDEEEQEKAKWRVGLGIKTDKQLVNNDHFFLAPVPDPSLRSEEYRWKFLHYWLRALPRRELKELLAWNDKLTSLTTNRVIPVQSETLPYFSPAFPSTMEKHYELMDKLADYFYEDAKNFYILTNNPFAILTQDEEIKLKNYLRAEAEKNKFVIQDWVDMVNFVTGETAEVDDRIRLAMRACILPPLSMQLASHSLIITNPATGKSRQFSKIGSLLSKASRASLSGFSSADKKNRRESILANQREAVIIDQLESTLNDALLADLFYLLDTGILEIVSAGDKIKVRTTVPIVLLGNPPESSNTRYSFYSFIKKIAHEAIMRRFAVFVYDENAKPAKNVENAELVLAIEKRLIELIRRFYFACQDKILKLVYGEAGSRYSLLSWVTAGNDYIKEYKEQILAMREELIKESGITEKQIQDTKSEIDKKIDAKLIDFFTALAENGPRMNGAAVSIALLDFLPLIYAYDLSEKIALKTIEEEYSEFAKEMAIKIRKSASIKGEDDPLLKEGYVRMYEALLAMIIDRAYNIYLPKLIEMNTISAQKFAKSYHDLRFSLAKRFYIDQGQALYKREILNALIAIGANRSDLLDIHNVNISLKSKVLVVRPFAQDADSKTSNASKEYRVTLAQNIDKLISKITQQKNKEFLDKLKLLFDISTITSDSDIVFVYGSGSTDLFSRLYEAISYTDKAEYLVCSPELLTNQPSIIRLDSSNDANNSDSNSINNSNSDSTIVNDSTSVSDSDSNNDNDNNDSNSNNANAGLNLDSSGGV